MPIVTVEKPLREKLGEDATDALVRLINQAAKEQREESLQFLEEKFERRLTEEISGLKTELVTRIERTRSEMIRWMFIFWVGQVAVLTGILFAVFK